MPGARGEGTIQAGDREITILFTNRALMEAEKQLGKSVLAVAQGFASGQSGITEVAQLLAVGMEAARRDARAGGSAVRLADAFDVLDAAGFSGVATVVMEAVAAVLAYDGASADDTDPNA